MKSKISMNIHNYQLGKRCLVCQVPITNHATYCKEHDAERRQNRNKYTKQIEEKAEIPISEEISVSYEDFRDLTIELKKLQVEKDLLLNEIIRLRRDSV